MPTLGELAATIPGASIVGDPGRSVDRFVHPSQVQGERDLVLIMDARVAERIVSGDTKKVCALIDEGVWEHLGGDLGQALAAAIVAPRARYALAKVSVFFPRRSVPPSAVHATAVVDPSAEIAENCTIGAGVCISANVKIGAGSVLHANVVVEEGAEIGSECTFHAGVCICDRVVIGDRVVIHPNAVIGSDGFAFDTAGPNAAEHAKQGDSKTQSQSQSWARIESFGTVQIGDDVEIGAGTTIDRATFGATVIESGAKIDNLVQIGHNCRIGKNVLLCSQVGLAGSTSVGHDSVLAGKVGVADHLKIGPHTVLMAKSGVTRDLEGSAIYYGMPARPVKETLRIYSLQGKLQELSRRLAKLERHVGE